MHPLPHIKGGINTLDKVKRIDARSGCSNYNERIPGCLTTMHKNLGLIPEYKTIPPTPYQALQDTTLSSRYRPNPVTVEHDVHIDLTKHLQYSVCTSTPSLQGHSRAGPDYQLLSETSSVLICSVLLWL